MTMDPTAATEAGFSIDKIKEAMDGLDPAALLPDIDGIISYMLPLCRIAILVGPILLLAMGIAYLLLAPKEANHFFGYRTYFGMGSVEAWRFTQKLAGMLFTGIGAAFLLLMLVLGAGFGSMAPMDMMWRAGRCMIWEAVIILLANIGVHLTLFALFDRKGVRRNTK